MPVDLSGGVEESGEFVLDEKPQIPEMRDAVNVWLEAEDCSFGMRIGIEAVAENWDAHEIWLDVAFADGRVLTAREAYTPHSALDEQGRPTIRGSGPLRFQCLEPFRRWRASFRDRVAQTSAQDLLELASLDNPPMTDVEFEIDMDMVAPPWVPGSLLPAAREALSGEQGSFMSPRYEQLFRTQGSLRVGAGAHPVSGNGLRIRRQGVRRFAGFWGHCWQSAVFPSGRAFGYNTYPPRDDGQLSYNEGFIFDGNTRKPARAVEIPWLSALRTRGDNVSFVLEAEDGERVAVEGETFINTRSRGHTVLPPDFPIVQQAHARYRWDNEETSGMVERSSPPSRMRL